jgi:hypothetical protein
MMIALTGRPPQGHMPLSEIYVSVEQSLIGPLFIRRMAGKVTWTVCGILRKET